MTGYTIRYRCGDGCGGTALIVEDDDAAYLYERGELCLRRLGPQAGVALLRELGWRGDWVPVPRVAPYTLDELRRLTGAGRARVLAPASFGREELAAK